MAYHFENIKLEKGMYGRSSRSFSQALEELDPSEHYRGTPLEGLDAFQRQLKRFDIHVKGAGSDMVEKFFHTSDSAVLFPEFVSRVVRQGMEEESILPAITATVTKFDGMDYRSIASVPSEEDKKLRRVEEGARIPETTVRTQENLVHLYKRGRMLVASYEAIRFQRLDLFSVTLRQIGAYIGRMHLEDAIEVLRNGDGNQNAAQQYTIGTKPITGTKGTLTYDALLEFWSQFDPYTMNTMLVGSDVMLAMLKLDEFQNPLTGLNFQGTGTLTTPLGAKLLRTSAMPAGILIGLDRNYALEQICGSEITVEYDKLIDRQLERAAITSISGFAEIIKNGIVKPEDIPRFAGNIYEESQRLVTLVDDILNLSRLDEADVQLEREDFDLSSLARDVAGRLKASAKKNGVVITVIGDKAEINGVKSIVDEMVFNLVDNAVKYNKQNGRVTVTVDSSSDGTALTVTDTGIGIPQADVDRVFERFYRVDKSHSKEIGGTGLGLSIVKHGAAFHNAKVSLQSTEGEGTTVRLVFPN